MRPATRAAAAAATTATTATPAPTCPRAAVTAGAATVAARTAAATVDPAAARDRRRPARDLSQRPGLPERQLPDGSVRGRDRDDVRERHGLQSELRGGRPIPAPARPAPPTRPASTAQCVAGCFAQPCAGVTCPSGQYCDRRAPASARCSTPATPPAAPGKACNLDLRRRRIRAPSVQCAGNQVCSGGTCVANLCAGVKCNAGSVCSNGTCIDTCNCGAAGCGTNGHCSAAPASARRPARPTAAAPASTTAATATARARPAAHVYERTAACRTARRTAAAAACPTAAARPAAAPSGAVLYGGSCCTPNCPDRRQPRRHVRRLRQDLRLPERHDALHGRLLHAELPDRRQPRRHGRRLRQDLRLPERRRRSTAAAAARPTAPPTAAAAAWSDGCGKTCACPSGSVAVHGRLLHAELPDRRQPRRHGRRLRQDLRLPERRRALRRQLLQAQLPHRRQPRRHDDGCGETCALPERQDAVHGRLLRAELPDRRQPRRACPTAAARPARCTSGSVLYGGGCCKPSCPNDGTCGAGDGCGGTCGCAGGGKCTNGVCPGKTCTPTCGCGQICNNGQCVAAHLQPRRRSVRLRLLRHRRDLRRRRLSARNRLTRVSNVRTTGRNVDTALAAGWRRRAGRGARGLLLELPAQRRARASRRRHQATAGHHPEVQGPVHRLPDRADHRPAARPRTRRRCSPAAGTAAGPCITEPENGTLLPNNWLRPRVKVRAPGATLLEIRFHSDKEAERPGRLHRQPTTGRWTRPSGRTSPPTSSTRRSPSRCARSAPRLARRHVVVHDRAGGRRRQMVYWALRGFDASIPDQHGALRLRRRRRGASSRC